jgi:hypothetical protein
MTSISLARKLLTTISERGFQKSQTTDFLSKASLRLKTSTLQQIAIEKKCQHFYPAASQNCHNKKARWNSINPFQHLLCTQLYHKNKEPVKMQPQKMPEPPCRRIA